MDVKFDFEKLRSQKDSLNEEEADLFLFTHFPNADMRKERIRKEKKEGVCMFFAYGMECPDMLELKI